MFVPDEGDSITEYKKFPGSTHYMIVTGKKWVKVADYALDRAVKVQPVTVPSAMDRLATAT